MSITDVLRYSADIPYNSAKPDLPPAYNDVSYGLDCFGFVDLLRQYYPELVQIIGTYGNGIVHAAAMLDGEFVDAFLRMKEPMRIDGSQKVETYYDGSHVASNLKHDRLLDIQIRRGWKLMNEYHYDLGANANMEYQPHQYRFTFLNRGCPVTIAKLKSTDQGTRIEVIGEESREVERILRYKYGFGVDDVAQMFFDAGQNSQYQSRISRW
jgi:hypothetical protein